MNSKKKPLPPLCNAPNCKCKKAEPPTREKPKGGEDTFKIEPYKSDRDSIYKTKAQQQFIFPDAGVLLAIGSTGTGKSVIICNLLNKFVRNYYDDIYVYCLSPCKLLLDVCKIPEEKFLMKDDPEDIVRLVEKQKEEIKAHGFKKAKHILIILDDCAQSNKFMRHPILQELAFAATHSKISVWMTTQSYMQISRRIRINVHYMILCHGLTDGEFIRFAAEYQSPYETKEEFIRKMKWALDEQYSFIFVNNKIPDKHYKFRKGFNEIIVMGNPSKPPPDCTNCSKEKNPKDTEKQKKEEEKEKIFFGI